MTEAELHLAAAKYATNRKSTYVEAMNKGAVPHMSDKTLNGSWLACYEGYREGYWVATGNTAFSTDPTKVKDRNQ